MTPKQVLEYYGSQTAIARAFGLSAPSVFAWFQNDVIPDGRQYQIELATGGLLRADKPPLRARVERVAA